MTRTKFIITVVAFLCLVSLLSAEVTALTIGISPYTKHFGKYHNAYNEGQFGNNELIKFGIEFDYNKSINLTTFENSCFQRTTAITLEYKDKFYNNFFWLVGTGIAKGYEKGRVFKGKDGYYYDEKSTLHISNDVTGVFYLGIGVEDGNYDYTVQIYGNCIVTGITYRFN